LLTVNVNLLTVKVNLLTVKVNLLTVKVNLLNTYKIYNPEVNLVILIASTYQRETALTILLLKKCSKSPRRSQILKKNRLRRAVWYIFLSIK
jgi:hypothetical protein